MKVLKWIFAFVAVGAIAFVLGPKPEKPDVSKEYAFDLPTNLANLEKQIAEEEKATKGLKPGAEAQIVWADTAKKEATNVAILYVHGFSATHEEGNPVHRNLAKRYGANLYLARWANHGTDLGDETFANNTADMMMADVEKALAITQKLGKEVIVVGTSAGGALTAFLASRHPEIKAIVLYSPCIEIYDGKAKILNDPWGLAIARKVTGGNCRDVIPKNQEQPKYWTMHYRLEGIVALENFMEATMLEENFAKIKCPVFLGYYYKNEEEQDKVVSVPAMLKMFEQLGTTNKEKMSFPNANNHVLASPILSDDASTVQQATEKFLDKVLKK